MKTKVDFVDKKYKPLKDKTLRNAVAHCIGTQFPRIGGPRIRELCADMLIEVFWQHVRPSECAQHGQVRWTAYSVDDPPARNKRAADTQLVALVLDLSTPDDIDARIERRSPSQRLLDKAVRLCHQAHDQGGLLSNCDLAELLCIDDAYMAKLLAAHERRTGRLVPRRATLHDVGTGLTHKLIICRKRYLEGKPSDQIARETYHSIEAVDRYLGQYDRVRHCRLEGMDTATIAYTLNCGHTLVEAYLAIDLELESADA